LLAEKTGAREFHSSARIAAKSRMEFTPAHMNESLTTTLADAAEIAAMTKQLRTHFSAIS